MYNVLFIIGLNLMFLGWSIIDINLLSATILAVAGTILISHSLNELTRKD